MNQRARFFFGMILALLSFSGNAQEKDLPSWQVRETENRLKAAAALREWELAGELIFEERPLLENTGGFGSSLLARIPDTGAKEGTFVLTAPLYGDFAVDTGLAFVLAALRRSAGTITPETEIIVAFLGDEKASLPADAGGGVPNKGLKDLLSVSDAPENWVLCYLDFDSEARGILIRHGDGEYLAPLEFIRPLVQLSRVRNLNTDFEIRYNEFHKLELAGRSPELALAWEAEVYAVSLASAEKRNADAISPEIMAELLLDYSRAFVFPVQNPDNHYNFFHFAGLVFFAPEKTSVQILVVFMGILILMILVYFTRWRRRIFFRRFGLRRFITFFWIFILLLPVFTFILKGSGLFYVLMLSLFHKPVPYADIFGMILVMSLGFLLFALLLQLPDYYESIKGNFYGFSALILAIIGLFAAIFLDLTYAPIFVWITFFSFIGLLSTKYQSVCIAAFFIPVHAVGALANLWKIKAQGLPGVMFGPGDFRNWMAYFQVSLILLPAILLFKKAIMICKRQKELSIFFPPVMRFASPALFVLILLIYALILPSRSALPVRRLLEDDGSLLAVAFDDTVFEESRILGLSVAAVYPPVRFDITLESDNGERPLVYSASCPLEEQENGKLALVLGENPPNPFSTELVISSGFSGFIRVEALYDNAEISGNIDPEFARHADEDYLLRLWTRQRLTAAASGNQGLRRGRN